MTTTANRAEDAADYYLEVRLLSDTTFGRGDGVPGLADSEVEYDALTGLPFVRGKTLRGLLVEEAANLLFSLKKAGAPRCDEAEAAAERLFGSPGSTERETGALRIGAARLPVQLEQAVRYAVAVKEEVHPSEILSALTTLRRQTALDEDGVADDNSLRTQRAVLRGVAFTAPVWVGHTTDESAHEMERAFLAACARCVRRGGTARTRGRGSLSCRLCEPMAEVFTDALFAAPRTGATP